MKRIALPFALALFSLSFFSCGSSSGSRAVITVTGVQVYERIWQQTLQEITPRATYELQCPAEQLSFSLIRKYGRSPVQVGISGCGQRILYVRPIIGGVVGSWRPETTASTPTSPPAQGF